MEAITGATHSMIAISAVREAAPVRRPEAPPHGALSRPASVTDEYVPGEAHTPSGLYWVGRDENGNSKVYFDNPESKPAETCTADTSRVDRELEQLLRQRKELAQRLASAADSPQAHELERKLVQLEQELAQKNNDTYRRQNTVFSSL